MKEKKICTCKHCNHEGTHYVCEYCGTAYAIRSNAEECESHHAIGNCEVIGRKYTGFRSDKERAPVEITVAFGENALGCDYTVATYRRIKKSVMNNRANNNH